MVLTILTIFRLIARAKIVRFQAGAARAILAPPANFLTNRSAAFSTRYSLFLCCLFTHMFRMQRSHNNVHHAITQNRAELKKSSFLRLFDLAKRRGDLSLRRASSRALERSIARSFSIRSTFFASTPSKNPRFRPRTPPARLKTRALHSNHRTPPDLARTHATRPSLQNERARRCPS